MTRDFPTAVIASLSTGFMLCDKFSKIHEAAEFLMGHPIWTHHFADRSFMQEIQKTILEQCPGMPSRAELKGTTEENYKEKLAAIEADIGKTVRIRKGSGLTAMLPEDGIPEHVKVIKIKL